ncbi:hypothetical protein FOZ61_008094 [Perkinsus olseni]|uniref:Endonuclease/exonuclease/phosphatase domain-containing protein n=1 Tax=Perkinsus olseni TaxID=32597 RepID=A0A7J6L676_PEROL|nr:hypothetical protein FOZ61_008094 [Perkinsus olseni]
MGQFFDDIEKLFPQVKITRRGRQIWRFYTDDLRLFSAPFQGRDRAFWKIDSPLRSGTYHRYDPNYGLLNATLTINVTDVFINEMRILNYNVRSLRAHLVEVRHMAKEWLERGVDVIVFTETWLKAEDPTPRISGYVEAGRKDRSMNWGSMGGRGGGVLIYVRDKIGYAVNKIELNNDNLHEGIDVAVVDICKSQKRSLQLVGIYVPPAL